MLNSAPSPNGAPSQNLVLALWKTAALRCIQTSIINRRKVDYCVLSSMLDNKAVMILFYFPKLTRKIILGDLNHMFMAV